jgi:hypothetical protein
MKRVKEVAITSRATVNVDKSGLGSSATGAERYMRYLGEARDARNTKGVELEEA